MNWLRGEALGFIYATKQFNCFYHVDSVSGTLDLPETMHGFVEKQFSIPGETVGDTLSKVEKQRIVRVTNVHTREAASFNELRAQRPIQVSGDDSDLIKLIEESKNKCPFEDPEKNTPRDSFPEGRVYGQHYMTASNIAKYAGWHGLVIFEEHNPLHFTREQFRDYIQTALNWFERVHAHDSNAIYPVIIWNCLWKSGASLPHGHMQTLMLGKEEGHYREIEKLRDAARKFHYPKGPSSQLWDYFRYLYDVHSSLGLAYAHGGRVMAHLTPAKEKEVVITGRPHYFLDGSGAELMTMTDTVYDVSCCYLDKLGVRSFNMVAYLPPINMKNYDEAQEIGWHTFPPLVRIVDRGNPMVNTADIGAVELQLSEKIIGNDPYRLIGALSEIPK